MLERIPEKVMERIKAQIPVGRLGRPDEIARVVHFLASDHSSYITGQVWDVNGGMDMREPRQAKPRRGNGRPTSSRPAAVRSQLCPNAAVQPSHSARSSAASAS